MNSKTVSKGASAVLSPGMQGFLWYLAETVDEPIQEFRLAPGMKLLHITHLKNLGMPSREYDITVSQSENIVSTNLIVRQEGSCSTMRLKEEVEHHG